MTNDLKRWQAIVVREAEGDMISRDDLIARYPGIEADLVDVDEWMRGPVNYQFATLPMAQFAERAQHLLESCERFPKDKARVNRIVKALRGGQPQWPVFLDTDFIMEGRHRIVAFYVLKLPTVPVVIVSKAEAAS